MDEKIFAVIYDWEDCFEGGHEEIFVRGFEAAKTKAQGISTQEFVMSVDVYSTFFNDDGELTPDTSISLWSWEWQV